MKQTFTMFEARYPKLIWLAALLILGGIGVPLAKGGGGMGFGELKNWRLTIYGKGEIKPEAILRIGSAQKTYQRCGFFRIGVLPGLQVKDVTVEILKPESVQDALATTDDNLQALGDGTRVEVYHLRVMVAGTPVTEIKADRLVMDSDGIWKLKGNITLVLNQQTNALKSAQLTVTGDKAGLLAFEDSNGFHVINLLSIDRPNLASPNH